jgi:electron transport complex protein RnfB
MAEDEANVNQCPPGGQEGVQRLAALLGKASMALNAEHGVEGPRQMAVIDEAWCIGCTLCIAACPTDAILGANKRMHTVIEPYCTGCELCIPVCPVDCIQLEPVDPQRSGWSAWSPEQAAQARERFDWHQQRTAREVQENAKRLQAKALKKLADLPAQTHGAQGPGSEAEVQRKRTIIEAALAKAKARAQS